MTNIIIGLDIAQGTTGMASLRESASGIHSVVWSHVTSPKGKGFYDDQERAAHTLGAIDAWIKKGAWEVHNAPKLRLGDPEPQVCYTAVLEDFAFGIQMAGTRSVAMVTGLIRYWIWKQKIPFVLVSPQSLKKFIVGKASTKGDKIGKEIVNRELFRRFGHEVNQNDAADAVGLAYIGAGLRGIWTPQIDAQREVLAKLKVEGR